MTRSSCVGKLHSGNGCGCMDHVTVCQTQTPATSFNLFQFIFSLLHSGSSDPGRSAITRPAWILPRENAAMENPWAPVAVQKCAEIVQPTPARCHPTNSKQTWRR